MFNEIETTEKEIKEMQEELNNTKDTSIKMALERDITLKYQELEKYGIREENNINSQIGKIDNKEQEERSLYHDIEELEDERFYLEQEYEENPNDELQQQINDIESRISLMKQELEHLEQN